MITIFTHSLQSENNNHYQRNGTVKLAEWIIDEALYLLDIRKKLKEVTYVIAPALEIT